MRALLIIAIHLLVTVAKLLRPSGARAVAAESLVVRQHFATHATDMPSPGPPTSRTEILAYD